MGQPADTAERGACARRRSPRSLSASREAPRGLPWTNSNWPAPFSGSFSYSPGRLRSTSRTGVADVIARVGAPGVQHTSRGMTAFELKACFFVPPALSELAVELESLPSSWSPLAYFHLSSGS